MRRRWGLDGRTAAGEAAPPLLPPAPIVLPGREACTTTVVQTAWAPPQSDARALVTTSTIAAAPVAAVAAAASAALAAVSRGQTVVAQARFGTLFGAKNVEEAAVEG